MVGMLISGFTNKAGSIPAGGSSNGLNCTSIASIEIF